MVSTKWLQGRSNLSEVLEIRREVFLEEMKLNNVITDIYDDFAFNSAVYVKNIPVGTGRLLFKGGRYLIDNLCVKREYRKMHYGDLIVRMLVRKAVKLGAENTYVLANDNCIKLFENIGFIKVEKNNDKILMMKQGDVGGHCGNK